MAKELFGYGVKGWIAAILVWATSILKFIDFIVSKASSVDLVASRSRDPGWIEDVWMSTSSALESIPIWSYPIMIFVGICILSLDRKRPEKVRVPKPTPRDDFLTARSAQFPSKNEPAISIETTSGLDNVGNLLPSSMIKVRNNSEMTFKRSCLIKIENVVAIKKVDASTLVSKPVQDVPNSIVVRTEGQCRDRRERSGPFTLRPGECKNVIVAWRDRGPSHQIFFVNEDGRRYPLKEGVYEMNVSVYGAKVPTKKTLRLEIGPLSRVSTELKP